jgi:hypothetical protein
MTSTEFDALDKYPLYKEYIFTTPAQINRLLTAIVYFRQELGYDVTQETFYNSIGQINNNMFDSTKLEESELKRLLKINVIIATTIVMNCDGIEIKDKTKIVNRIKDYIL